MRAHSIRSERHQPASLHSAPIPRHTVAGYGSGIISEIDYSVEHPMTTLLLLPLLQQLAAQSRWLLWLAPQQKISRHWLQQSGLPLGKVIQPYHLNPNETVDAMEKALLTGNYSVVLCWLEHHLTEEESMRLRQAAQIRKRLRVYHETTVYNRRRGWTIFSPKNSFNAVPLSKLRVFSSACRHPDVFDAKTTDKQV